METWILIPLFLFIAIGIILTAVGLFGNIIVFLTIVVYALITRFNPVGIGDLIVMTILYVTGELLEYVFTLLGVKWLGASKLAGWMAILGTILGAMIGGSLFWVFGVVIGGFLGAMTGASTTELFIRKDLYSALKAGLGAFIGKAGSVFVKLVLAIIMVSYLIRLISSK